MLKNFILLILLIQLNFCQLNVEEKIQENDKSVMTLDIHPPEENLENMIENLKEIAAINSQERQAMLFNHYKEKIKLNENQKTRVQDVIQDNLKPLLNLISQNIKNEFQESFKKNQNTQQQQ